jgi:hypothetical protein
MHCRRTDLLMFTQRTSELKKTAPAPAAAEVDSDEEGTMTPSAAKKASKHILAQSKASDGLCFLLCS